MIMNSKIILAAIAGGIASFLLGWLVYGILLMDFMTENTMYYANLMKDPPNMITLFASGIFWSALFAFIFHKWAHINSFMGGVKAGLPLALLINLANYSSMHAFFNLYTRTWLVADTVIASLFFTLIAGIIGATLGMGKK
jgi:hypothetical protein